MATETPTKCCEWPECPLPATGTVSGPYCTLQACELHHALHDLADRQAHARYLARRRDLVEWQGERTIS
ncbi:MAG: hypothetical protein V3S01_01005 [Dehalococcoidia bacterium]